MLVPHRNLSRVSALVCALAVGSTAPAVLAAPVRPVAATIAFAFAPANEAALEIDVDLGQPDDEAVADRIHREIVRQLNAEGISVKKTAGPGVGTIRVAVRWNGDDNHVLTPAVIADGQERVPDERDWVCETCREDQLLAKAADLVPSVVPLLPERADDVAGDPTQGNPDPGTAPPTDGSPERSAKLGPLEWTGISMFLVGVGGVIAGGVLTTKGVEREFDAEGGTQTDYRPPGRALLGVGAGLLVVGLALIVTGRVRAKKASQKNARVVPVLSPSAAGVSFVGRF